MPPRRGGDNDGCIQSSLDLGWPGRWRVVSRWWRAPDSRDFGSRHPEVPQRYLTRSTFLGLVESPTSHCTRVRYRELSDTRSVPLTATVLSGPAADREQGGSRTTDAERCWPPPCNTPAPSQESLRNTFTRVSEALSEWHCRRLAQFSEPLNRNALHDIAPRLRKTRLTGVLHAPRNRGDRPTSIDLISR